ncbi:MAG: divalent-cation tolerance protein CutA [Thiohalocapsa sp.]|jgi:periplasmic divalent cation tolerance protein|uniref:divalent-cation tolerance protein CutA n=1 Tax=Thiohalocapsa sp. TaxID=2497641 RepID=UPI0025FF70B2|nr:divalent-cation tolerance protein CutA [Thiohalocapsa sp.]MCG6941535.1 divalent-cation tolerance protein CutA [Thiohalocapsa sp.]
MSAEHPAKVYVAYCTCPDAATAESLAGELVEAGLAACVNILPSVRSVYRWQGAIERDEELLMLIKTSAARVDALIAHIRERHPYDVPEVICHPISAGNDDYLDWVRQCTKTQA